MEQTPGVSEQITTAPLPQVSVPVAPPPGKKGPVGMAPRQEVTRVNAGTPPALDVGSEQIRSIAPPTALPIKTASRRGFTMNTMSGHTSSMDELIREAMLASAEASIQKTASAAAPPAAQTPEVPSTKVACALADACVYAASELRKEAALHQDPTVTQAADKPLNTEVGHAKKFPMPGGGMAGNVPSSETISGGAPTLGMVDQKSAKVAQKVANIVKKAADPKVTQTGDAPPKPAEGATQLVASNQAAIDATRREAAAPDKKQMDAYLKTPMQAASQDSVLKNQVQHTDQAGAKVAEAKTASVFDILTGARTETAKTASDVAAEAAKVQATDDLIKKASGRALLANLTAAVRAQGGAA